ncbi:expansin EXLX1 family cellulose-binding protein [Sphaerotilus mobilis]|uniref:Expansin (Peptidoglycan-binding protein) n=1 Tax=Sphaerotilus mobilis TaxID=47994 RepID=A0A4Q7LD01_9BURK|nr:expansin EXLX1 family cellulose-binding protein [Sphaerotilus mobilis]RZS52275.1 expansin (peptidoglycan-binding protein) [Sphaerotilus mobilis]
MIALPFLAARGAGLLCALALVACGGNNGGGGGGSGGGSGVGGGDGGAGDGAAFPLSVTFQGDGTFYDYSAGAVANPDTAGACSLGAVNDRMIAAMNAADYAGSAACGAQLVVRGPNGSVTVRVVDKCPECAPGDVDLSAEAFERIAAPIDGRVDVSWQAEPASVAGPVSYRYKEGSSRFWTAIQVRNHRLPIAKLEIRPVGSTGWVTVGRTDYNYFVHAQTVPDGALEVRVTASDGSTLQDTLPAPQGGLSVSGRGQFP